MYVVSVSKTYLHRGNHRHRRNTKKYWHLYYYDEDFRMHVKRINWLQALYYKTKKVHRFRRFCTNCDTMWDFFVKSKKKIKCPNCS